MKDLWLVLTNTASRAEAQAIAEVVMAKGLAAAVQIIGPVESRYRWQGQLERSEEWICLLKSSAEQYEVLEQTIKANHSYELPGILAIPVVGGSDAYLAWLRQQVGDRP